MERMGDILARTVVRRAQHTRPSANGSRSVPPSGSTPARTPATSRPLRASRPPSVSERGQSSVRPRPNGYAPPAPTQPASRTPRDGAPARPLARADLIETPPGSVRGRALSSTRPPADGAFPASDQIEDPILELSPRSASAPVRKGMSGARLAPRDSDRPGEQRSSAPTARPSQSASTLRESGDPFDPSDTRPSTRSRTRSGGVAVCPLCGGVGFVRQEVPLGDPSFGKPVPCECKERQLEERRRSDLRRLSSLDPFLDKTFDTFDPRVQGVREAFDAARTFAANPDGWLILSGPTGVGKTHLAAAVANYQLAEGNSVFFSVVPELLDHLRAAFAPGSEIPYDELFDRVRESGLLVLDDLGAENSTPWATEKLFQLMNYRYNYRMPTVITTNARLFTQMDERLRSRLSDISLTRHAVIKAQDYREHRTRRPGTPAR
ncbi:MAG TPA: ATP-binding protein [Ktedonobacterales bacterium]